MNRLRQRTSKTVETLPSWELQVWEGVEVHNLADGTVSMCGLTLATQRRHNQRMGNSWRHRPILPAIGSNAHAPIPELLIAHYCSNSAEERGNQIHGSPLLGGYCRRYYGQDSSCWKRWPEASVRIGIRPFSLRLLGNPSRICSWYAELYDRNFGIH